LSALKAAFLCASSTVVGAAPIATLVIGERLDGAAVFPKVHTALIVSRTHPVSGAPITFTAICGEKRPRPPLISATASGRGLDYSVMRIAIEVLERHSIATGTVTFLCNHARRIPDLFVQPRKAFMKSNSKNPS
jgi:hypothetical protein